MSKSADEVDNLANQSLLNAVPDSNNNDTLGAESQLQILPEYETDNYDANSPMLERPPLTRYKSRESRNFYNSDNDERTPMTKNEMIMYRKRQQKNKKIRKSESENEFEASPQAVASSSETIDTRTTKIKKLHFRNLQNVIYERFGAL